MLIKMIRHYVLLATDGYVYLPQSPDPCSDLKKKLYVFGFVGGLFKVTNGNKTEYINNKLDWTNPDNCNASFWYWFKMAWYCRSTKNLLCSRL